ncbi:hypothetical protein VM94_04330 [Janthinobacterium sp. KBS0711]|nr:hypothetical protein VM94_04330 [Janthinobacterium sp. KBS0711]
MARYGWGLVKEKLFKQLIGNESPPAFSSARPSQKFVTTGPVPQHPTSHAASKFFLSACEYTLKKVFIFIMTIQNFQPERCFIFNTDLDSFRLDYPDIRNVTPFTYWLAEGFAYATPSPSVDTYDQALSQLIVGDIVFAYENLAGIVAMGTVLEVADLKSYFNITPIYPDSRTVVKRVRISWDTSFKCSVNDITTAGTTARGGSIPLWRVKSHRMKGLLTDLASRHHIRSVVPRITL